MNKAPAYQWYPEKAILDTRRLSWKAKGLYRELLDVIWMQFQETCCIPDDDEFIASELGCDLETWISARQEIQHEHRKLLVEKPIGLFSKGLWKEREKQVNRREQLRRNGMKGGRPKTKKNQKGKLQKPNRKPKQNQNESLLSLSLSLFPTAVVKEAYKKWFAFREEIKHPLTETAIRQQAEKLNSYEPKVAVMVIENSINSAWRGLFPPNSKQFKEAQAKKHYLKEPK